MGVTVVGLEEDGRIGRIATKASENVEAAFRCQVLIEKNDVPFVLLAEQQGFFGGVTSLDPAAGKEPSQAGGDQLDFVRSFIDEEDIEGRFRQRHGRFHGPQTGGPSFHRAPAGRTPEMASPYSEEDVPTFNGTRMDSGSRWNCMSGSISYTALRIPARCPRGRGYFGRGVGYDGGAKMITSMDSEPIMARKVNRWWIASAI